MKTESTYQMNFILICLSIELNHRYCVLVHQNRMVLLNVKTDIH